MTHGTRLGWISVVTMAVIGCGAGTGVEPEIPNTPDGTVRAVIDGLVDHRPDVAWRALPPSYQADVTRLTQQFADTVDPALFDRVVAVSRKATVVLQSKKDLILASDTFAQSGVDPAVVDAGWESAVHMIDEVLSSDLADLESLRRLDVEALLAGTGAALMDHVASLPPPPNEDTASWIEQVAALDDAQVELLGRDGDDAEVSVSIPNTDPIEISMRRVEERWIPADLADEWPDAVAEAEADIASMSGDEAAQTRMQLLFGLGVVETFIDQIDEMTSPEDFDALVGGLVGGLLQSQAAQAIAEG